MAKRNIRKTDSETTTIPEVAHAGSNGSSKPARTRRKADKPAVAANAAEAASSAPASVGASAPATPGPERPGVTLSHEQIAVRAYHIFLERGGRPGDQFADWVTAERQLREQLAGQRA